MQEASESKNNNMAVRGARAPPALDPERVGLTQPYKDFVAKGWIISVTVEITPGTTSVKMTLGDKITKTQSKVDLAPGQAKEAIINEGLWSPGNKGKKNSAGNPGEELPKRSLCKRDFEGNDTALQARVTSVAKEIGDERARGRVGSLRLMQDGVDKFDKWWANSSAESKIRLLADKKAIAKLEPDDFLRFDRVITGCPFRGEVPTPSAEDEEEEDDAPIKARGKARSSK